MARRWMVALLFAVPSLPAAQELEPILARVSEEAEMFLRKATSVIGRETLAHKGRKAPPRIRWISPNAQDKPEVSHQSREIVSEYGFGHFKEAPEWLREFRQVISVDGRNVLKGGDARLSLAQNMTSEDDRLRKQLLQNFERFGQIGAATDFGQMLLLFRRRELGNYTFERHGEGMIGANKCAVLKWTQNADHDAARIYAGRKLERVRMEGELWVRAADFLPLRITMRAPVEEDGVKVLHAAEIDYRPFRYGVVLPVSVTYRRTSGTVLMTENIAFYHSYQMFSAETEIKFTPTEEPQLP